MLGPKPQTPIVLPTLTSNACNDWCGRIPVRKARWSVPKSCCWRMNILSGPISRLPRLLIRRTERCAGGAAAGWRRAPSTICRVQVRRGVFPPPVRAQATAIACSLPHTHGVPLSRWSAAEIAQCLQQTHSVPSISASTIRRWLTAERLHPWRYHL